MGEGTVAEGSGAEPLFIVGCGRSGTTLLRLMLNSHPDLCIPGECHVLYKIARKRSLGLWPRPGGARWVERFLQDARRDEHLQYWGLDHARVRARVERLPRQGLGDLFQALFDEMREREGKARWGDKTPLHVQYLLVLDAFFPRARFLHLIRDARDVAQSVLQRPWGPRHISHAGLYWKWLVLSGMVSGRLLGPARYQEVYFEELVREPEKTLRGICAFAGLEYTDRLLRYHEGEAAQAYARAGDARSQRLSEPLQTDRLFEWRRSMPERHRRSMGRQAGSLLALHDYECDGDATREQRDRPRLEELLSPAGLARVQDAATPATGSVARRCLALQVTRCRQARAFLARDWEAWARASVRWQRTVVELLRGPGQSPSR